jgi:phage-related protein
MVEKYRTVEAFRDHFYHLLSKQTQAVRDKVYWTIKFIEEVPRVSDKYLKKLEATDGLYEIRIQFGGNIFRIFCFFDDGKLIILLNGFAKKTQKTPRREIELALRLKDDYYAEKK